MSKPVISTIYPFIFGFYYFIWFHLLKAKYHLRALAIINFPTLKIINKTNLFKKLVSAYGRKLYVRNLFYLAKKWIDLKKLSFPENKEKCLMIAIQERMCFSWILSRKDDINVVLSWEGFNILIRNEMAIFHSNIQYLTSVNAPTTEMSTVVTILDSCLKTKEQLRLKYIVCVFDQNISCKTMELKWRYPDRYNGVTLLDPCLKTKEQLRLKYIVCVFDQTISCKTMELKWRYPDRYNGVTILDSCLKTKE